MWHRTLSGRVHQVNNVTIFVPGVDSTSVFMQLASELFISFQLCLLPACSFIFRLQASKQGLCAFCALYVCH